MGFASGPEPIHYKRVMVFVDGQYFVTELEKRKRNVYECISQLKREISEHLFDLPFKGELIRSYWYDAKYDREKLKFKDKEDEEKFKEKYEKQQEFFMYLHGCHSFEMRYGEYVRSSERPKQKGVDVLITVDMLTKAYEDHYDIAVLVSGDRDFIPLIKDVKNQAGKRVYGVYFISNCPPELMLEFDESLEIYFIGPGGYDPGAGAIPPGVMFERRTPWPKKDIGN